VGPGFYDGNRTIPDDVQEDVKSQMKEWCADQKVSWGTLSTGDDWSDSEDQ